MKKSLYSAICLALMILSGCDSDKPIFRSNEFAWYPDRVEQGTFTAVASDATHLESDYRSPKSNEPRRLIEFKLSINGKDNEMLPGINHSFLATAAEVSTPTIKFGEQLKAEKSALASEAMDPNTKITFRVDMNDVFADFDRQGFYPTPTGDVVYKEDFQGVWIAGGVAPLIWDFDNIMGKRHLQLTDPDGDRIYEATLLFNEPAEFHNATWRVKNDLSAYPRYTAPGTLENAMYNLSLDEMVNAIEVDSTLRTGAEWAGVWTRDVSYSIILSMAHMQTEVSKKSLLHKVNSRMRIIQDTGTGGAWPCSTDRMIWAAAAWEIFLVTGDMEWLNLVYPIICNSIEDDRMVAYNKERGLMMGESSFIDWRDQSYPKWMQPVDIYQSICLGTNIVHVKSLEVAAKMAEIVGDNATATKYTEWAEDIKAKINERLYMPDKGYYAAYLYGRNNYILEPRSESLGEALSILWDIAPADRQREISENMPFTPYGAPIFYPYIEEMPPYHNNAVWPFVSAYCGLAYAKAGNEAGVMNSIATIYRAAALFCTNKENFEATSGDHEFTQINSSNMLWSLSGNIAMTHKLIFGMNFEQDGLRFTPFVPDDMKGTRRLENFRYRNATLDITLIGSGSCIDKCEIDGNEAEAFIPAETEGAHKVVITLKKGKNVSKKINLVENKFAPRAINNIKVENDTISWSADDSAAKYLILLNEKKMAEIKNNGKETTLTYPLSGIGEGELQLRAFNKKQGMSFASEPIRHYTNEMTIEAESAAPASNFKSEGFSGKGFIMLTDRENRKVNFKVTILEEGDYAIDVRYANGNGPTNTDNRCAIRSLTIDGEYQGSLVMPQRGVEQWSNWGWSNPVISRLDAGEHTITIEFMPWNVNMNMKVNNALLDCIRLVKMSDNK